MITNAILIFLAVIAALEFWNLRKSLSAIVENQHRTAMLIGMLFQAASPEVEELTTEQVSQIKGRVSNLLLRLGD